MFDCHLKRIRSAAVLLLLMVSAPACSQEAPVAAAALVQDTAVEPSQAAPKPILASAAAAQPEFVLKGVLGIDRHFKAGEYAWDDSGVPAGPMLIAVDLGAQRIYVYRGGIEIGRSSILYGADNKPTPTGTFPILQKKRHHVSNLYGAPMPYMMRLTMDGIAIHGSQVEDGSATHGCVGLPEEFAALLFEEAKVGDRVLITKEWLREVYYRAKPVTS